VRFIRVVVDPTSVPLDPVDDTRASFERKWNTGMAIESRMLHIEESQTVVAVRAKVRRRYASSATIRAVAELAGVSSTTVSNVINGIGEHNALVRARVHQAIRNTGYKPNLDARTLNKCASARIALIYSGQQVPFLDEILFAAFNTTASLGAQLVLRASSSLTKKALTSLALGAARNRMQGILLAPHCAELLTGNPALSGMRVAAIAAAGAMPDMHTVRIDNRSATVTLTEFLIRLGHRRIGFITGSKRHGDSKERRAGYEQAMQQADIPMHQELIADGEFTFESGRSAAEQLLDLSHKPTAIIACNDEMAAGALWGARQRGLKLPDDLSIAGFDDTPTALKTWPPLTVIRQPIASMVERAVTLLMDQALQCKLSKARDVVLNYTLVERDSTAPFKPYTLTSI